MSPDHSQGAPSTACIACGGTRWRVLHHIGPYAILQCPHCLLAKTRGASLDEATFYNSEYFVGAGGPKGYADYFSLAVAMERTNRTRIRRLLRLAPHARTLLDVGCGPGFFVKAACDAGIEARGLEISDFAANYAREKLGLRVVAGPVDDAHLAQTGGPFDLITLWDTLEHLRNPDEALRLLTQRLTAGGVLSLSTGDIASFVARMSGRRWHLFNLPEHLWFFSAPSLKLLLRHLGMAVVTREREVCWYTAHYLLERLSVTFGWPALRLPGTAILKRLNLPLTLLDIMTVHASAWTPRRARRCPRRWPACTSPRDGTTWLRRW